MNQDGIVVILSGFPRRSETFALNEVLALEKRGALAAVFATKPGDGKRPHPDCAQLLHRVHILPDGTAVEQAEVLARQLGGQPVSGIHAYFAHTPTEVAAHAARRLNVPYGFSVHALDARKVPPRELARRAREAACVVACNVDVVRELNGAGVEDVRLLPHGVDSRRFYPRPFPPPSPFRLLAVGRLVEKKGFDVLIQAAAQLSQPFQLRIVGDGPERERLKAMIEWAELGDRLELRDSQTHDELTQEYAEAHLVVVPSVVDRKGDRDGLPNVVLEAMACGRPVVASDVGAISSAITSGYNGFLVPPGDATALAEILNHVGRHPHWCETLGRNGRKRVERDFELERCTERFCAFLESTYQAEPQKQAVL
jgi:glycosyltransferase involved in cell wall biosynthesis